jgi:hypothetical protein
MFHARIFSPGLTSRISPSTHRAMAEMFQNCRLNCPFARGARCQIKRRQPGIYLSACAMRLGRIQTNPPQRPHHRRWQTKWRTLRRVMHDGFVPNRKQATVNLTHCCQWTAATVILMDRTLGKLPKKIVKQEGGNRLAGRMNRVRASKNVC